jgi:hypothetical protein
MALVRCACQVVGARCTARPMRVAVAVVNVAIGVLVVGEVTATVHWAAKGRPVHHQRHQEVCSSRAGCCVQGRELDPGVAIAIATALEYAYGKGLE